MNYKYKKMKLKFIMNIIKIWIFIYLILNIINTQILKVLIKELYYIIY